jgi:hypothetical protein
LGWRAVALSGEEQAIARVELRFGALFRLRAQPAAEGGITSITSRDRFDAIRGFKLLESMYKSITSITSTSTTDPPPAIPVRVGRYLSMK